MWLRKAGIFDQFENQDSPAPMGFSAVFLRSYLTATTRGRTNRPTALERFAFQNTFIDWCTSHAGWNDTYYTAIPASARCRRNGSSLAAYRRHFPIELLCTRSRTWAALAVLEGR